MLRRLPHVCALAALAGCARRASPAEEGAPRAQVATSTRDAAAAAERPVTGTGEVVAPIDGATRVSVEWVVADVLRVKTLRAISVDADEIRCPRITRVKYPPTPKEMGWRRAEGDVVEYDEVTAHHVSARLVVADEIEAVVVKRAARPRRWARADGGAPVRNHVFVVDPDTGKEAAPGAGLETPVF